jgi:GNAT superfamily N-acetyltransferase
LIASRLDENFHIDEVSVDQRFRGMSIGKQLLEHALSDAVTLGFHKSTLTTDRSLPWNQPHYARNGFQIIEAQSMSPPLAACLAELPNPELRCAMERSLL